MFLAFAGNTQVEKSASPHGIKMDFKLPVGIANKSFRSVMSGIADVDLAYQYHFSTTGLFANMGLKYGYWEVATSIFSPNIITGKMQIINPFVGIGYRQELSDFFFMEYELKTGFGNLYTDTDNCNAVYKQSGFALEPKISGFLKSSDLLYFGLNVNYVITNSTFTPENLCTTNFPGFTPENSLGIYQYLSVGVGFYALLPGKK